MERTEKNAGKAKKIFNKKKGGNIRKFDETLSEAIRSEDFVRRAITKIGLPREQLAEIDPIRFECCDYSSDTGDCLLRIFKDGSVRSSNYSVAFLIFGQRQLYVYQYRLSLTGEGRAESLSEIYYEEISGVTSESKYIQVTDATNTTFSVPVSRLVVTAGGTAYEVAVPVGNPATEAAVLALRLLIRTKK